MKLEKWPILYHDILRVKDKEHHLGICTLWTQRDVVQKLLENIPYNTIGNLYSAQGINALIRNTMANPNLRTIVIWGSEMSLSGHSFLQFMKKGIDKDRKIISGRGEIEREIPDEAIELFRKNIQVVDMRGKSGAEFVKEVKNLGQTVKKPFAKEPVFFPKSQPILQVLPSEQTGFRVSAPKVAQTWLKLLAEIYKYGRPKHTRYSQDNELKEILNLTAVVTQEDPEKEYFPDYLPFTLTELKAYYAELLTDREVPGVAYNYGKLLRKDFGVNQVEKVKALLKKRPDSKKMAMTLIDPVKFWNDATTSDTPCLTQLFASVQDNKFFLTAHFRSQDMVHGWPRNTFALRKLQKEIADSAEYDLGPLTMITHSAHVYGDDFRLIEDILSQHYEKELGFTPSVHFDFDPRGNVVVEVIPASEGSVWIEFSKRYQQQSVPYAIDKMLLKMPQGGKNPQKLIRATLYAPDGGAALKVFEGRVAQEIAWQISDWHYLKDPGHLIYVGLELQKAEDAIKRAESYNQDPA